MTTNKDIIKLKEIGMIQLALLNKLDITLSNLAFAPKSNFNLISFNQLREAGISYHNNLESII